MTASIIAFPEPGDLAWRPIANALQVNVLAHTGSQEITDAVEAHCRAAFERCFPNPSAKLVSTGASRDEISDVINTIIGRFVGELCQMALDLELLKREGGNSGRT